MKNDLEKIRQSAQLELNQICNYLQSLLELHYNKKYEIQYRIKTVERMLRTQHRFPELYGHNIMDIPDIIGIRILVANDDDCVEISNIIKKYLNPYKLTDYFDVNTPKITEFKAFLYYFNNWNINAEIQIMTFDMCDWTNRTHKEHEIRKYGFAFEED